MKEGMEEPYLMEEDETQFLEKTIEFLPGKNLNINN